MMAWCTGAPVGRWRQRTQDSPEIPFDWKTQNPAAFAANAAELRPKVTALSGLLAAAPAAVTSLAAFGLDAADATDFAKETADFERLIADPAAAISRRKSLTAALRPAFAEIADLLAQMDRLVLRFRRTEAGTAFAAAWQAARIIRDLGTSGPADPTPPTT